jgi:hypothetical protein
MRSLDEAFRRPPEVIKKTEDLEMPMHFQDKFKIQILLLKILLFVFLLGCIPVDIRSICLTKPAHCVIHESHSGFVAAWNGSGRSPVQDVQLLFQLDFCPLIT